MIIYLLITWGKCKGNRVFHKLRKGLFFNSLFIMAIEGMNEFLINGYLNIMTAEISLLGEIIGISLSGFCVTVCSTILPLTIILIVICKNEK